MARRGKAAGHAGKVAALGGTLTLLVVAADVAGVLASLEDRSLDLRFEHAPWRAAPLHDDIVFVDIDDGSLDQFGRWPWPREQLGLALGEIARAGARTIVIDLLLTEPDLRSATGDAEVAKAIAAAPTVLALDFGDQGGSRGIAKVPVDAFGEAARAVGFVGFAPESDGALRRVDVARRTPEGRALQLGLAGAAIHLGVDPDGVLVVNDTLRFGERELPLDRGRLWLDWPTPRPTVEAGEPKPDWARCAPRCTIGYALDVAQTEQRLAAQARQRDVQAAVIAVDLGLPGEGAALLAALREETTFRLADARDAGNSTPLTAEEQQQLEPFLRFGELDAALAKAQAEVADARRKLADLLSGKLVFVGWTATGAASDFVPTPLSSRTPGVMAHAVVADMAMTGRALTFAPRASGPLLALLLGAIATAGCLLPLAGSLALFLAVTAGWVAAAALAFGQRDFVLPFVAPIAAGSLAWVGATALQAALAQRDQRRITRQFKARVAPELVDFLVDHPDALSRQGEPREVTALFLDLAGFTSLSEKLGAQATVALLNRCMTAMTGELTRHGAYVNKYLGDGLMAFWSAFRIDPEQAAHACRAALAVQECIARVEGAGEIAARIGIATGRVIVGDCGAPPLLHDYTAIGDAINLAARLESANKQFGTRILVDGPTREQAKDPATRFRGCGRVVVVGQSTPVELFEVVAADVPSELIELTEQAVADFRARRLADSAERFRELEQRFGASKLAHAYLDAIARAGPDFDGVLHLASK